MKQSEYNHVLQLKIISTQHGQLIIDATPTRLRQQHCAAICAQSQVLCGGFRMYTPYTLSYIMHLRQESYPSTINMKQISK
jgi:hypothetical protein